MQSHASLTKKAKTYLDLFDLGDNQYIIGIYQKGITIHHQQIRALNIFYSLHVLGKINPETKIGIIGGGVAGTTFAFAALHSNMKVSLFEKGRVLIPLQKGSQTRQIHPNIYSYPSKNSRVEETDLPICNWGCGFPNDMRDSVLSEEDKIKEVYADKNIKYEKYFQKTFNVNKITSIVKSGDQWLIEDDKKNSMRCDILIYAIGFGIEKELHKDKSLSYWQCGIFHQENIYGKDGKFLISGTGDGGMMELIINTLDDFKYSDIIKTIEGGKYGKEILDALARIQALYAEHLKEYQTTGNIDSEFLWKKFQFIDPELYKDIVSNLKIRPTDFILHGKRPFKQIFDLGKVSLLNAFLVFLIKDKVNYKPGNSTYDKNTREFIIDGDSDTHVDYDKYMRHGTNLDEVIDDIPNLRERITKNEIKKKQSEALFNTDVEKLFTNDQFNSIFKKSFNENIATVTGNALQFLETFATTLANSIDTIANKNFRLTIHKVFEENSSLYYRQVVPYFGSDISKRHGGFGRLFKWNNGSVGYSVLKGKPLLILRNNASNENAYQRIIHNLNLEDKLSDYQQSNKKSILALPVLASSIDEDGMDEKAYTNFIIYIDSEEAKFFTKEIFDLLIAGIKSFVSSFENLIDKEQIKVYPRIHPHKLITSNDEKLFEGVGRGKLFGDNLVIYENFLHNLDQVLDKVELKGFYSLT